MKSHTRLLLLTLVLLPLVQATAQKVSVGFDRSAAFSKFKTYSWTKGMPAKNPEVDRHIIDAIEHQLDLKGLRRTTENPDVYLSYHAAVVDVVEETNVARPGTWNSSQAASMAQGWLVKRGSLIVVLQNAGNQDVWRAIATDTVSTDPSEDPGKDISKRKKKITKAVEKIFKTYPPNLEARQ